MPSSPLAFIILAPAATIGVIALFCLIVGLAYVLWIKPLLDWATRKGGGFFKTVVFWPLRKAAAAVTSFANRHIESLTRAHMTGIAPMVSLLDQTSVAVQRLAGTIGDEAEQTWRALWTLRHVTVPKLITTALVPVRAQLERHTGRLNDLEDLNRRVAVVVGAGLRSLPWGAPGSYVGNFQAWWNTYTHLWTQVFEHMQPQLRTLATETVPQLARDVADLARRLDVQIDARLDALGARIGALETLVEGVITGRLDALEMAVDALAAEIFEGVGAGLTALTARIVALEQAVAEAIPLRFEALELGLATLRAELEEGIRIGIGAFQARVEALEEAVFTTIPQTLAAMQLQLDAIAAEIFEGVGTSLRVLTERIVAIETTLRDLVIPQLDLVLGRIAALEQRIETDLLPRLRSIEGLLAPVAFAALVLATMRQVAPNLFCRNVTDATRRICAQDETLWQQLLAGTLVFAIALNPREIAAAGTALTGILGDVIADTVDH